MRPRRSPSAPISPEPFPPFAGAADVARWRLLVFLAALAVGGTFIVAGSLKALDVEGFARDIALHKIVGPTLAAISARILIPFEIAVGAAAILGYRRRLAWVLLGGALVVFIAGTGGRGRTATPKDAAASAALRRGRP
jgi:uncharacterized membrane protein YphA (DoxX/SURF4 family)